MFLIPMDYLNIISLPLRVLLPHKIIIIGVAWRVLTLLKNSKAGMPALVFYYGLGFLTYLEGSQWSYMELFPS